MSLTKPILLAPINVATSALWSSNITGKLGAGATTDLDLPSYALDGPGDYYLTGDSNNWDWLEALKEGVTNEMAVGFDYSLDVTTGRITFTQDDASDDLVLTFNNLPNVSPYLLGFGTNPAATTITVPANDVPITGDWHCGRRWYPNALCFHPENKPVKVSSAPRTLSGANGLLYDWSGHTRRSIMLAAVKGARVFQWAAEDALSFGFAIAAGFERVGQRYGALDSFVHGVLEQAALYDREPPPLLHLVSTADNIPRIVHLVDKRGLDAPEALVKQVSPEPLLYRVELTFVDKGAYA